MYIHINYRNIFCLVAMQCFTVIEDCTHVHYNMIIHTSSCSMINRNVFILEYQGNRLPNQSQADFMRFINLLNDQKCAVWNVWIFCFIVTLSWLSRFKWWRKLKCPRKPIPMSLAFSSHAFQTRKWREAANCQWQRLIHSAIRAGPHAIWSQCVGPLGHVSSADVI